MSESSTMRALELRLDRISHAHGIALEDLDGHMRRVLARLDALEARNAYLDAELERMRRPEPR